jgi:hypothetical protein
VSTDQTTSNPPEPKVQLSRQGETIKAVGITRPIVQRSISLPCLTPKLRRKKERDMPGLLNILFSAAYDRESDSDTETVDPDRDTPDDQDASFGSANGWNERMRMIPEEEDETGSLETRSRSGSI